MLKKPFILKSVLEAFKGSYFSETFTWSSGTPSVVVDLTGYEFEAMFRDSYAATDPIKEISTTDGGINVTAIDGKVEIVLEIEDTDLFSIPLSTTDATQIPYKDFPFDIDAIPPDTTKRFQFLKGVLRVYGEVTR